MSSKIDAWGNVFLGKMLDENMDMDDAAIRAAVKFGWEQALGEVMKMSKEMFTIEKRDGDEAFATVPVKMIHASDIEKLRGE